MNNGTLHVKQYNGPWSFCRSVDYEHYSNSRHVQKIIGPITVNVKIDHEAIIRQKAAR